jgi:hypothetical protein
VFLQTGGADVEDATASTDAVSFNGVDKGAGEGLDDDGKTEGFEEAKSFLLNRWGSFFEAMGLAPTETKCIEPFSLFYYFIVNARTITYTLPVKRTEGTVLYSASRVMSKL